jgi:hypothetical protein
MNGMGEKFREEIQIAIEIPPVFVREGSQLITFKR